MKACRRLEMTSAWFPKKAELVEACRLVLERKRLAERPRLALPEGQAVPTVKVEEFKQRAAEHLSKRGMRR